MKVSASVNMPELVDVYTNAATIRNAVNIMSEQQQYLDRRIVQLFTLVLMNGACYSFKENDYSPKEITIDRD